MSYARGRVNDWLEDDDGFHVPSVHCIQIGDVDGHIAVLGYLVEIHGQGGPHPMYCGLFANLDSFYSHLREIGLVLSDEIATIGDEVILELWEGRRKKR